MDPPEKYLAQGESRCGTRNGRIWVQWLLLCRRSGQDCGVAHDAIDGAVGNSRGLLEPRAAMEEAAVENGASLPRHDVVRRGHWSGLPVRGDSTHG